MSLNKEEILELMTKAKELGLTQVKVDGFEASFGPTPIVSMPSEDKDLEAIQKANEEPSHEELLYWSTPYYDELVAKRKAREEQLKQHKDVEDGKENTA